MVRGVGEGPRSNVARAIWPGVKAWSAARRPFCERHRDVGLRQRLAVEHAEMVHLSTDGALPRAEACLSPEVERDVRFELTGVRP
jgi:hypothetical protein